MGGRRGNRFCADRLGWRRLRARHPRHADGAARSPLRPRSGAANSGPSPFVTDLGVRVSFVTETDQPDSVDVMPPGEAKRRQYAPAALPKPGRPAPRIGTAVLHRPRAVRAVRLPLLRCSACSAWPTPATPASAPTATPDAARPLPEPTRANPEYEAAPTAAKTLIHQLLAGLDLRRPLARRPAAGGRPGSLLTG